MDVSDLTQMMPKRARPPKGARPPEGGAQPPATTGAAGGMPGSGGDACPCADGAVDPRSAAEAAAWRTGRRAGGVRDEAKALR